MGLAAKKLDEKPVYERLNVTKLAFRFDLDRGTVRDRIQKNAVQPVELKAKESIYELTPKLEGILSKISSPLDEAKLRALKADAAHKELNLAKAQGNLVSKADATEFSRRIIAGLYREIVVNQPKRLAAKLARARNAKDIGKALKSDSERIFKNLRDEPDKFAE